MTMFGLTLLLALGPGGPGGPPASRAAELVHITPMVTLMERPDALRRLLPGAASYFARDVQLPESDLARLAEQADWQPEEPEVRFYYARDASGKVLGATTFVRVDTRHGSIMVAVGFTPDDRIRDVLVTQASEETIPWLRQALSAHWTDAFQGVAVSASIPKAEAPRREIGAMARYMGKAITTGVRRAAALYTLSYRKPVEAGAS